MILFITAFVTGLAGSFHCAGMCGPIAFALPVNPESGTLYRLYTRFLYNAGRIITYALLGAIIGAMGFGLQLAGMQQSISMLSGVLILVFLVFRLWKPGAGIFSGFNFSGFKFVPRLFSNASAGSLFVIGLLNGLLPCGFVYVALAGSVATQSVWGGAVFMVLFGLGTFPMMYGVSLAGQFLSLGIRKKMNSLTPVITLVIALVFIVRGLNLGIPYLSPKMDVERNKVEQCCRP